MPAQNFCVNDLRQTMEKRSKQSRLYNWTVFTPDGTALFYWLAILSVSVFYNWWTIILRQAFPAVSGHGHGQYGHSSWTSYSAMWRSFDVLGDIIILTDIFVQLRTGYLEQGLLVRSTKPLAWRYLRSTRFLVDAASLVPLQYLMAACFSVSNANYSITEAQHEQMNSPSSATPSPPILAAEWPPPILRLNHLLKSYRVISFYHMIEMRAPFPNLIRVGNLTHILLLGVHWFACFHYMFVVNYNNGPTTTTKSTSMGHHHEYGQTIDSEINNEEINRSTSFVRQTGQADGISPYLLSLYWSTLTLTTIGNTSNPSSNSGYLFTIVSYLIGVFVFATIVGQVGNVITNRNASRLEFERLLDGAKFYMRNQDVSKEMQKRVQRWYDYSWSRGRMTGGSDIQSLTVLPVKLKTELALQVNLNTLKKVSIFQECQPEFLHDLVLKMRSVIFTPGDIICRKGEVAREMYIIADGVLQVISDEGTILRTLKAGDFFGEIGILNLEGGINKRTADVRSLGYSELFSLSRDEVLTAMKDHPEAAAILREYGRRRLNGSSSITMPSSSNYRHQVGTRDRSSIQSDGSGIVGRERGVLHRQHDGRTNSCFSIASEEHSYEANPKQIPAAGRDRSLHGPTIIPPGTSSRAAPNNNNTVKNNNKMLGMVPQQPSTSTSSWVMKEAEPYPVTNLLGCRLSLLRKSNTFDNTVANYDSSDVAVVVNNNQQYDADNRNFCMMDIGPSPQNGKSEEEAMGDDAAEQTVADAMDRLTTYIPPSLLQQFQIDMQIIQSHMDDLKRQLNSNGQQNRRRHGIDSPSPNNIVEAIKTYVVHEI